MQGLPPTRPLILEIKGNSLDDGPGIRTVVFFKGCPLDCSWCHNPESKKTVAELSFDEVECVGCERCIASCVKGALSLDIPGRVERPMCDVCGACVQVCPSKALSVVGRKMDVEDVAREVARDKAFFDTSGGGVTLSGGEPTMFMDFSSRLLERLRDSGIHTIVETCGLYDGELFDEYILPFADAVYFDLKIFDEEAHRRECGASNATILENFTALASRQRDEGFELLARVPLVPGITATPENLAQLAGFIRTCGMDRVALLEYNPLWLEKAKKLGRPSPFEGNSSMGEWMERDDVERCKAAFEGLQIV